MKQRWFCLTLKTILFLYHDAWKISLYINIDEVTVFQRRNNVSLSTLNQRRNLTLKQRWFWVGTKNIFCSYIMILKKLKSLYQRWKGKRISTSKQCQFINVKSAWNLTLKQRWFRVDHKTIFVSMFQGNGQRKRPFPVSCRFMKTFINVCHFQ